MKRNFLSESSEKTNSSDFLTGIKPDGWERILCSTETFNLNRFLHPVPFGTQEQMLQARSSPNQLHTSHPTSEKLHPGDHSFSLQFALNAIRKKPGFSAVFLWLFIFITVFPTLTFGQLSPAQHQASSACRLLTWFYVFGLAARVGCDSLSYQSKESSVPTPYKSSTKWLVRVNFCQSTPNSLASFPSSATSEWWLLFVCECSILWERIRIRM